MSAITWCLVTIAGSGVTTVGAAVAVEAVIRWRERRRAARPAADPVDEAYDTLPAGRPDQITAAEMAAAVLTDADVMPMWARQCLAQIQSIPTSGASS